MLSHLTEGKCWSGTSTSSSTFLSATRHATHAAHAAEAWHTTKTTREALCSSSTTSASAASVHKVAESTVFFHVLCEEHLKNLIRIERHATSATWHTSHVKAHATREACAGSSSGAIISHIIHAHAHVVLLTLIRV